METGETMRSAIPDATGPSVNPFMANYLTSDGSTINLCKHDDAFVPALKSDGIVPTGDPAGVVAWAHWACDQLNQGANKEHVVAWLSQYNPNAANGTFLRKAALYYCPEHNNKLAGW